MTLLVLGLLGIALGSSINALVYRLHAQAGFAKPKNKKQAAEQQRYSMLKGRSMCPDCKHELAAKDLIPLVSWLSLRGKCRYCRKPISVQYPLVEAGLALLFIISYVVWPMPLDGWYAWVDFGIWLASLYGMLALFIYDLRWSLLPLNVMLALIGLALLDIGLLVIFGQAGESVWQVVQFYLLGLLPVAGLYLIIYLISTYITKRKMVGDGDITLGAFIGLSLGWPGALLVLFLANVIGALIVLPGLLSGKLTRSSRVPFGPFLVSAYVIAGLWGDLIIDWYLASLTI